MCGRFTQPSSHDNLARLFGFRADDAVDAAAKLARDQ
jgi:hypothetical protein